MSAESNSRSKSTGVSRRTFLAAATVTTAAACAVPFLKTSKARLFKGAIVGANSSLGHAMRDGKFPAPTETAETGIVIVGGGIGGLAAARRLNQSGFNDFVLLELDAHPGGNAISGENKVSSYPWGAHYVPIAGSDMKEVAQLFEELGIIRGRNAEGLPIYNEEFLCADPMERLFIHGRWQEGTVPQLGITSFDKQTMESFFAEMHRLKDARGRDGLRAFTIPLDESSNDEEYRRLDSVTMAEYLRQKGWDHCEPLRWYVNYCCRDDYGAGIEKISAWAGVHYFASRDARAANAPGYAVVTWPEGNGWLVKQMQGSLQAHIRSSCAAWNVHREGEHLLVDYFDVSLQKSMRLKAKGVIWAAPYFVAQRAIGSLRQGMMASGSPLYSPWMVANLTLKKLPVGRGMEAAWDNVIYHGNSLGYVVATHQVPHSVRGETVISYYLPLDEDEPATSRKRAMERSHQEWCELIVADLSRAHQDIAAHISIIDVWLWGHAMVRPVPGFIWGNGRTRMKQSEGNIIFANSDVSGISIFEEAYTRGVRAADTLIHNLGQSTPVS